MITVLGSLNADLVVRVPRFLSPGETLAGERFDVFPGGKGGNQACAAARLGARVRMIGRVGGDAQGAWLRDRLADAGVDVSRVTTDEESSSGVALITIDAAGQNTIVVVPGANGRLTPALVEQECPAISESRVLLLQLEVPLPSVLRAARAGREAGAIVVLDPAPAQAVPDDLLALADYVTPNEVELMALAGGASDDRPDPRAIREAALALLRRGAHRVLVKLGDRGAELHTAGDVLRVPAFPVTAVDTTAAGDAFNGALAAALGEAQPIEAAMRFASAAAALSVTRAGAQTSMPAREDVEALLAGAAGVPGSG